MGYDAEIWGWKERKEIEKIHERYLRWTMGVNRRTPGYIIREELKRGMMRGRTGKSAWRFERRLEERRGGEIARKCLEEMKKRWRRGKIIGKWKQERKEFMSEREVGIEEEETIEHEEIEKKIIENKRWKIIEK